MVVPVATALLQMAMAEGRMEAITVVQVTRWLISALV